MQGKDDTSCFDDYSKLGPMKHEFVLTAEDQLVFKDLWECSNVSCLDCNKCMQQPSTELEMQDAASTKHFLLIIVHWDMILPRSGRMGTSDNWDMRVFFISGAHNLQYRVSSSCSLTIHQHGLHLMYTEIFWLNKCTIPWGNKLPIHESFLNCTWSNCYSDVCYDGWYLAPGVQLTPLNFRVTILNHWKDATGVNALRVLCNQDGLPIISHAMKASEGGLLREFGLPHGWT